MLKHITFLFFFSVLSFADVYSQALGFVIGAVKNKNTQEPIAGAVVMTGDTSFITSTDVSGKYKLEIPVGTYRLKASFLGFVQIVKENIVVTSGNAQIINFELEETITNLKEVDITFNKERSADARDMVTPLSIQQLTTEEIKSNPGGNFDVSRVIQTLPGVGGASGGASRNDVIIRGGAPNENVYYLDGIEIPVLNHFQTQGSSGGAIGILNVSFIEDVKLSSSAFDARYDNVLASTLVINQREGNPQKLSGNFRVSGTETALTLEGPLGNKTNYLLSARRSYLQYLFKLIDLPIRPQYWDFQYKVTHKFNNKTTLTAIGLGAIDDFGFAKTKKDSPEDVYIIRSLPYISQWNYTSGFALRRLISNGFINVILSRNMFNNELDKFEDEKRTEGERSYKLRSQEIENKFRFDINKFISGWKFSAGFSGQYVKYNTALFSLLSNAVRDTSGNIVLPAKSLNFSGAIDFYKYGAFASVSKNFFDEKLLVSTGIRTDMNSFIDKGNDALRTLSPRLSVVYRINSKFDLTGSIGSYYKIPTYTVLGYKDENGVLVNKPNLYIQSNHYVGGMQYLPKESLRFTLEGFYKKYNYYPVSVSNGISLANQGADFGSIGSEKILSSGTGECYGFEFFAQQKLIGRIFYVFSYTYVRSLFSGLDKRFVSSSWDSRHLISTTIGYKFKRNWQLGIKYRFSGGTPYTPFDLTESRENYLLLGKGVLDFSKLNTKKLKAFNQVDLRLDKKINFKRISIDVFIDIQNALLFKQESASRYTFKRNADNTGFETTDGLEIKEDGSNAIPVLLEDNSLSVTPTIGFIFEF